MVIQNLIKSFLNKTKKTELNFIKEFRTDPCSENSKIAFENLKMSEFCKYFNYKRNQFDNFFNGDHKNNASYTAELYRLIEELHEGYKRSVSYLEMRIQYTPSPPFGYIDIQRAAIQNYERVCRLVKITVIPELIEDIQLLSAEQEKTERKIREKEDKIRQEYVKEYASKREFLIKWINEMEAKNVDRKKIEEKIKEKFYQSFGEELRNVRRTTLLNENNIRADCRWKSEFKINSEWRTVEIKSLLQGSPFNK